MSARRCSKLGIANSGDDARAFKHCKNSLYWNNSGARWRRERSVARRFRRPRHGRKEPVTGVEKTAPDSQRLVEPALLGKGRSRDRADDPYLAAALAGKVAAIVTYDRDLLDLGKLFGIPIIRPAQFLVKTGIGK